MAIALLGKITCHKCGKTTQQEVVLSVEIEEGNIGPFAEVTLSATCPCGEPQHERLY